MPRLGKINRYRPASDLITLNNKNYDLRQYVVGHWGFESPAALGGTIPDLSENDHDGTLSNSAIVLTDDYPGIFERGRLTYDPSGANGGMTLQESSQFRVNKPFSISFWLKLSDISVDNQQVFSMPNCCKITYSSGGRLMSFTWYEDGNPTGQVAYSAGIPLTIANDEWFHVTFTYRGDTLVGEVAPGVLMSRGELAIWYFNGVRSVRSISGGDSGWTNLGLTSDTSYMAFTAIYTALGDSSPRSFGSIEWWSKQLSSDEVNAIYQAQINEFYALGFNKSGFISRSPRLQIRELDDLPGSYSTVRRTGDPTRTGTLISSFNDETSIVFSESEDCVFPLMLPENSQFISQAVDIVGQESDIKVSLPIRPSQQPNHLHYSPTEDVGPFDENRMMPATDFFMSGTDSKIIPGFSSPTRSKIAIEIDITPQSNTLVMRNVNRRTTAEGGASIGDKTGFLYYNFDRNQWEQIGLKDPALGTDIYYDHAIEADYSNSSLMSGTFPMQFGASWQASGRHTTEVRNANGYRKIGTPTVALGAPFKTKYHATSSQCLKLSNYINAPFLLEKVKVEFDSVNAQRIQGDAPYYSGYAGFPEALGGASRDIDNYVFFAYKQNRSNRDRDSLSDVSGSQRSIIFSGSMTFWNSPSFYNESPGEAALYHSPAFSYDFNLPYDSTRRVGSFTGSISMELSPAVANRQDFSTTLVYNTRTIVGVRNFGGYGTGIRNFWPGGASATQTTESWSTAAIEIIASPLGLFDSTTFEQSPPYFDSRAVKFYGNDTDNSPNSVAFTGLTNQNVPSSVSPYLLFPEDEIVFGLDAGITPFKGATTYSSITGSFLRINNGPCKVTLYGSLISDSKELLPSLNQDLSSNSIHELVGAEPVLDQFMIEPRSSYYGSYLDDIVTGSMAVLNPDGITFTIYDQDSSRRVIGRVST